MKQNYPISNKNKHPIYREKYLKTKVKSNTSVATYTKTGIEMKLKL